MTIYFFGYYIYHNGITKVKEKIRIRTEAVGNSGAGS
jgi:ribosomal protein L31E